MVAGGEIDRTRFYSAGTSPSLSWLAPRRGRDILVSLRVSLGVTVVETCCDRRRYVPLSMSGWITLEPPPSQATTGYTRCSEALSTRLIEPG